ncbi:hypothetical protein SDC9_149761 [bioreactor metagenome]|uniref:Uncharacterized protein n=1 Tax=bioreactor metagenome TaxID=1076179 RepID=A0A645EKI1_9ZZZZ
MDDEILIDRKQHLADRRGIHRAKLPCLLPKQQNPLDHPHGIAVDLFIWIDRRKHRKNLRIVPEQGTKLLILRKIIQRVFAKRGHLLLRGSFRVHRLLHTGLPALHHIGHRALVKIALACGVGIHRGVGHA